MQGRRRNKSRYGFDSLCGSLIPKQNVILFRHCEERSDDSSAETLAKAEAIHFHGCKLRP